MKELWITCVRFGVCWVLWGWLVCLFVFWWWFFFGVFFFFPLVLNSFSVVECYIEGIGAQEKHELN